jgi:hypothetical protein
VLSAGLAVSVRRVQNRMMIWFPRPEPDGVGVALTIVLGADEEMGVACRYSS